jgi:hypothetical protein
VKIANITPVPLLNKVLDGLETYHLVLTSLMNSNAEYRDFYRDRIWKGDFVILDNDAFELGESLSVDEIASAALEFRPNEIVLPDKYDGTMQETIDMAREALQVLPKTFQHHSYHPSYFGVIHGENWEKYITCATTLAQLGVTTLGINEEVEELFGFPRQAVVKHLSRIFSRDIQFHLLGKREDMSDILDPFVQSRCRGCDSGKLIRWGLERELVRPRDVPPYPGRGDGFFERDADEEQLACILWNVQCWRKIANGQKEYDAEVFLQVHERLMQREAEEKFTQQGH